MEDEKLLKGLQLEDNGNEKRNRTKKDQPFCRWAPRCECKKNLPKMICREVGECGKNQS